MIEAGFDLIGLSSPRRTPTMLCSKGRRGRFARGGAARPPQLLLMQAENVGKDATDAQRMRERVEMSYSGSFFAFALEGDWTNEPYSSPLGPSQDSPSPAIGSKGFKKSRLRRSCYLSGRLESNKIDGGTERRNKDVHHLQAQKSGFCVQRFKAAVLHK